MPKLTKTFVDQITAPVGRCDGKSAQAFYRDDALSGFAIRVTNGGTKSFILETRIKGKLKRMTLGRYGVLTVEEARKLARSHLGDIAKGDDPVAKKQTARAQRVTLIEAFEDYLNTRKDLKPGTLKDYWTHINKGLCNWQKKSLVDISKDMVQRKHTQLGLVSPARANGAMRVLRAVFNHAIKKYEDAEGNPVIRDNPVLRLSENRAWYKVSRRQQIIRINELALWYEATNLLESDTARDYLHLLLFTGLRREEALSLKWSDVDFRNQLLTITVTKNGDPHELPLNGYVLKLLQRRRHQTGTQWVFPSEKSSLGYFREPAKAIDRVKEMTGLRFSSHDLRRTFITVAESLDIPAYALKRLMNHRDSGDVTNGYIISNVDRLREPMQKIDSYLQQQFLAK